MNILIAPNAFKNSLTANDSANAILDGLMRSRLYGNFVCFPIGDGGDGTGTLLAERFGGTKLEVDVKDPVGRKVLSSYYIVENGKTAIIEMATASGIRLLDNCELDPLHATSVGTGELMVDAMSKGVEKVIIGMGGSATVDGGVGILHALGMHFLDSHGQILTTPENLSTVSKIDDTKLDKRIKDIEIIVLCDVNNKLLGPEGAAAMFGPQKGASPEEIRILNSGLLRFSEMIFRHNGKNISDLKYGGAAGGAAAGLGGLLNATLVNGADYFLQVTGFEAELKNFDLLITGEGSIDDQSLQGKGPVRAAHLAKKNGLVVIGLAGKVPLHSSNELSKYFDIILAIGDKPSSMSEAIAHTRFNLSRMSTEIGNLLYMLIHKLIKN